MYYYLYDENGVFEGMTETQPEHDRWTNIPNTYSFVIEKWNGSAWVEGATIEEIIEYNNQKIEELNQIQFEELSRTDWYYTRQIELGTEIPIKILNERKEIREKYNILKNQLK